MVGWMAADLWMCLIGSEGAEIPERCCGKLVEVFLKWFLPHVNFLFLCVRLPDTDLPALPSDRPCNSVRPPPVLSDQWESIRFCSARLPDRNLLGCYYGCSRSDGRTQIFSFMPSFTLNRGSIERGAFFCRRVVWQGFFFSFVVFFFFRFRSSFRPSYSLLGFFLIIIFFNLFTCSWLLRTEIQINALLLLVFLFRVREKKGKWI